MQKLFDEAGGAKHWGITHGFVGFACWTICVLSTFVSLSWTFATRPSLIAINPTGGSYMEIITTGNPCWFPHDISQNKQLEKTCHMKTLWSMVFCQVFLKLSLNRSTWSWTWRRLWRRSHRRAGAQAIQHCFQPDKCYQWESEAWKIMFELNSEECQRQSETCFCGKGWFGEPR